jgi:hypothetical protein
MDGTSANAMKAISNDAVARANGANHLRRFLSLAQLSKLPPPTWHVDQILPANSLACLYGPSDTYKTFISMSLGLCIANGIDFAGRPVTPGSVAYVAGEGSGTGFRKRWYAWNRQYDGSAAAPLRYMQSDFALTKEKDVSELRELLKEAEKGLPSPFGLVIIDTLARALGDCDENSTKDMGRLIEGCQALQHDGDRTVLLVAHTGKKSQKGIRGSSALFAALDTVLATKRVAKGVQIQIEKQKESEKTRILYFEMKKFALPDGGESLVPVLMEHPVEEEEESPKLSTQQQALLAAVVKAGESGLSRTVAEKDLSMSSSTFYSARTGLKEKGLVIVRDGHVFVAPGKSEPPTAELSSAP